MNQRDKTLDTVKKTLKFVFGIPLTLLCFYFIGLIIFHSKDEILGSIHTIRIFPLAIGTVLLAVFYFLRAAVWRQIIANEGFSIPMQKSIYLLSKAELRRYIPGNILAFASRVYAFQKEKIPKKTLIKSIGIEAFIFLISSLVVSIPAIIYIWQITSSTTLFSLLPIESIIISSLLIVLLFFIAAFYLLKKFNLSKKTLFKYIETFLLSVLSWVFFGVGNLLVASSIIYIDAYLFIPIASFLVLSWLIGYLSFITPMGLGVREAFVIYIFSFLTPISLATTVAIFLRIALISSELITLGISYLVYKYNKFNFSPWTIALSFSVVSYITYFTYATFQKHLNFFTGRFDLGNMDQTVWNTINGRFFLLTNPDGVSTISRLGIHADFFLALISPFYLFWSDPRMLLFIQSAVTGSGAIFVYLLSNKIIQNKAISFALSFSYLLNPFVEKQNLYDFHSVALSTTFLLGTFYFLYLKKYVWFGIFLILSVFTKENIFLISSLFGLYMFLNGKRKAGIAIFISSLIIFYFLISKVIPYFRGADHFALAYFQDFGNSPGEIIKNIIFNPFELISQFISARSITYLYSLFLPLGFLGLLSPLYLLFSSPDLFINIISSNKNFTNMTFHYSAAIIPFIYISAIFGVEKLLNKYSFITPRKVVYYIIFFALLSSWSYGPLPGSNKPSIDIFTNSIKERGEIRSFMSSLPKEASVAASNNLGAHLSQRENIYTIPSGMKEADYILFLVNDPYAQPSLLDQQRMVNDLKFDNRYIEIYSLGDFTAFKKK